MQSQASNQEQRGRPRRSRKFKVATIVTALSLIGGLATAAVKVETFRRFFFSHEEPVNCTPSMSGVQEVAKEPFTVTFHVPCPAADGKTVAYVVELLHRVTTSQGANTGSLFFFKIENVADNQSMGGGTMGPNIERNFYLLRVTSLELNALKELADHESGKPPTDTGYYNKSPGHEFTTALQGLTVDGPRHSMYG